MIPYIIHLIASDACLKMYRQMNAFVLTSELKLKPLSQFMKPPSTSARYYIRLSMKTLDVDTCSEISMVIRYAKSHAPDRIT